MDQKGTNRFPKAEHLKSRKQIEQLFAGGKTFFIHPIKVYFHFTKREDSEDQQFAEKKPGIDVVKVGVSASKRNFKNAVDRNRVKRLLRESYRLNKQELLSTVIGKPDQLQVFFIYVDKTLPTFEILEAKMKICIQKLQKIVEAGK